MLWFCQSLRHCGAHSKGYRGSTWYKQQNVLGNAQALRTAQKNIKLAREEVEEMLGHLDTARQVSNYI